MKLQMLLGLFISTFSHLHISTLVLYNKPIRDHRPFLYNNDTILDRIEGVICFFKMRSAIYSDVVPYATVFIDDRIPYIAAMSDTE